MSIMCPLLILPLPSLTELLSSNVRSPFSPLFPLTFWSLSTSVHSKYAKENLFLDFSLTCSTLRPWQTRTYCCGHIVADTNVSQFAQHGNTTFILSRAFARPRNIMSNNVPATMCPRLPVPLFSVKVSPLIINLQLMID